MERLIVFTRYPYPGKAKTRLIPALGTVGAAALQRQMAEHTLRQVRHLIEMRPVSVEVWFAGGDAAAAVEQELMQDWLGNEWAYRIQGAGSLGDRLIAAFQAAFADGNDRVMAIGTDCPELDAQLMAQALEKLQGVDLVIGDATDGGYYLVGLRRPIPELFVGIDWGTSAVRQQTVAIARSLSLEIEHLLPLTDIDYPDNLPVWEAVQNARPGISLIVPVLNEAIALEAWGNEEERGRGGEGRNGKVELIVVDGGSVDGTVALAEGLGARVVASEPGRARQMNRGAAIAQGNILLFLHVDTRLPEQYFDWVQRTLAQPGVVAGAFELAIAGDMPGLRWVERGVKWRSHLWQMPYGDQAIFLKAETFWQVGGYADLPIMEDFELMKRLQKLGRVAIAPASVITSARRWQKLGVLKTTLLNQLVVMAYSLGVSPTSLARLYRRP